jgi:hypothetical protein
MSSADIAMDHVSLNNIPSGNIDRKSSDNYCVTVTVDSETQCGHAASESDSQTGSAGQEQIRQRNTTTDSSNSHDDAPSSQDGKDQVLVLVPEDAELNPSSPPAILQLLKCNHQHWRHLPRWIKTTVWPMVNDMHINSIDDHSKQSPAETEDADSKGSREHEIQCSASCSCRGNKKPDTDTMHVRQAVVVVVFFGLLVSWAAVCGQARYHPFEVVGRNEDYDESVATREGVIRGSRIALIIISCLAFMAQRRKTTIICLTLTTLLIQCLRWFLFAAWLSDRYDRGEVPYTAQERIEFLYPDRLLVFMWLLYVILMLLLWKDHRFKGIEKLAIDLSKIEAIAVVLLISGCYALIVELIQNAEYGSEQWAVLFQIGYLLIIARTTAKYDIFTWISCGVAVVVLWILPSDDGVGNDKEVSPDNSGNQRPSRVSKTSNTLKMIVPVLGPAFHCAFLVPMYVKFMFIDPLSMMQISLGMLKLKWRWLRTAGIYMLIFTIMASQQSLSKGLENMDFTEASPKPAGFSRFCSTRDGNEECETSYEYCASAGATGLVLNDLACGQNLCTDGSVVVVNRCRNVVSHSATALHISLRLFPDPAWSIDEYNQTMSHFLIPLYLTVGVTFIRVVLSVVVYAYHRTTKSRSA